MNQLTLSYSIADQSFERTKSLGILNLSMQLAEALAGSEHLARFTVFSNRSLASRMKLRPETEVLNFDQAADSGVGRMAWDQWGCYSAASRAGNRWLFLPKGFSSFIRKPPIKLAAYVHDAMHDYYARRFSSATRGIEQRYFARSFLATLRHADVIFTNSAFTQGEVLRLASQFGICQPRTCVAGIGFNANVPVQPAEKANRVVVLASRWPHKRTDLAIAWMQRWQTESKFDGKVHFVGALPDGENIPVISRWQHHTRLEELELQRLLDSARALVYFSEYEGFGMPPVEAVLAGACPVFSEVAATREVMRDSGCPFANDNYESFHRAMNLAFVVQPEVIEKWKHRLLAEHSWDAVVRRVIEGLNTSSHD